MELIQLLQEEDFGFLAGELLIELTTRYLVSPEIETESQDQSQVPEGVAFKSDSDLDFAIRFLKLRLIEPARRLSEAERLAGSLQDGPPLEIRFADPEREPQPTVFERAAPGIQEIPDQLDEALERLRMSGSTTSGA